MNKMATKTATAWIFAMGLCGCFLQNTALLGSPFKWRDNVGLLGRREAVFIHFYTLAGNYSFMHTLSYNLIWGCRLIFYKTNGILVKWLKGIRLKKDIVFALMFASSACPFKLTSPPIFFEIVWSRSHQVPSNSPKQICLQILSVFGWVVKTSSFSYLKLLG